MSDLFTASYVRRADLEASFKSPAHPGASDTSVAFEQLRCVIKKSRFVHDVDAATSISPDPGTRNLCQGEVSIAQPEAFTFRLFHQGDAAIKRRLPSEVSSSKEEASRQAGSAERRGFVTIDIRSPSPPPIGQHGVFGGFRNPYRNWDFYFTEPQLFMKGLGSEMLHLNTKDPATRHSKEREFELAAVRGEEVKAQSYKGPFPACCCPWRVIDLSPKQVALKTTASEPMTVMKAPSANLTKSADSFLASQKNSRHRPNKKRRMYLRRIGVLDRRKNETEVERRNRKNREKKQRKREKVRQNKGSSTTSQIAAST